MEKICRKKAKKRKKRDEKQRKKRGRDRFFFHSTIPVYLKDFNTPGSCVVVGLLLFFLVSHIKTKAFGLRNDVIGMNDARESLPESDMSC